MEGETEASINTQLKLFHERVLPTLDNNIKDGNSLINIDFYGGEIDFGQEKKVKPFNWRKAFPEVFMQGGFDCVIGNPPYLGGREWKEDNGNAYEYFINKYEVAEYQFDIYALFWEVGITLLKDKGLIGYITPNTWLNNQSNKKLRQYILRKTQILQIVDYSKIKVFDQATVLPIITVLQNTKSHTIKTNIFEPKDGEIIQLQEINQGIWADDDLSIININLSTKDLKLRDKIEADSHPLESLALIKFGIKIYETGKGTPKQKATDAKQRIFEADKQKDKSYRKYLEGKDINPFKVEYKNRWLKYGINLAAPRDPLLFEGERILVRRIVGKTLIAAYTNSDYVTSQLLQIVKPNEQRDTKFLLGIINSKLLAYYFRKKYNRQDKTFPEIRIYELASLPIRKPNESQNTLKKEIEKLVDKIIELQENKGTVILQSKIDQIQNQIDYCEQKLNDIVYALYGLTSEEVELIENS